MTALQSTATSHDLVFGSDAMDPVLSDQETALMNLVSDYAERLERNQIVTPEEYIHEFGGWDESSQQRALAMLRSAYLLFHAGTAQIANHPGKSHTCSETSETPAWLAEHVGGTLGDYRILREIGRGAMGIVFEAEQLSLSRRVALKILPPAAMLDERQVDRFVLESQIAAKLQHSNIVPIYGVGKEHGIYFYSMQLVDRVSFPTSMPPREVARIGESVARGLHWAHGAGVIHRDIKPSNLLLDHGGKVWIADFGLARLQREGIQSHSQHVVGTMRYMSPEQACGISKWIDHRTDIYALGVTLYEMLTGRCPYDASDRLLFLAELERGEPIMPRSLCPNIPVDLETVVLKAMASNPENRYATAMDLADDLQCFLDGKVIQARRPSLQDRLWKWGIRHRKWLVAAFAMWTLFSIGLTLSSVLWMRAEKEARIANEQLTATAKEAGELYTQARSVVDHFGVSLSQDLAHVPGAEKARRQVLRDTLRYYRDFLVQAGENPERLDDIAATHLKIARIAEQLEADDEAVLAYRQAIDLLKSVSRSNEALALAANSLGILVAKRGDLAEAERLLEESLACNANWLKQCEASKDSKANFTAWHQRSITLMSRADIAIRMGKVSAATQSLAESQQILQRLSQDGQVALDMQPVLAWDQARVCGLMAKTFSERDRSQSMAWNEQAIKYLESFCTSHKSSSELEVAQRRDAVADWIVTLCNQARLVEEQLPTKAMELLDEAIEVSHRMSEQLATPSLLEHAVTAWMEKARLHGSSSDNESRMNCWSMSLRTATKLAESFPSQTRYQVGCIELANEIALKSVESGFDAFAKECVKVIESYRTGSYEPNVTKLANQRRNELLRDSNAVAMNGAR